jgi:hypothetical protein
MILTRFFSLEVESGVDGIGVGAMYSEVHVSVFKLYTNVLVTFLFVEGRSNPLHDINWSPLTAHAANGTCIDTGG